VSQPRLEPSSFHVAATLACSAAQSALRPKSDHRLPCTFAVKGHPFPRRLHCILLKLESRSNWRHNLTYKLAERMNTVVVLLYFLTVHVIVLADSRNGRQFNAFDIKILNVTHRLEARFDHLL
jgi:hypothetical protein